jgi:hypothetical protein
MNKKFTIISALLVGLALGGCTDPDRSRNVLDQAGYTNIRFHGHAWFGCSEDDNVRTEFTATGPSGKPASGVVCCQWSAIQGMAKNCTVRLDSN